MVKKNFGCRLACSSGPGNNFGCRLACSSGPGKNFGCRLACRLWVQTVQTMDELEIPKVGRK